MQNNEEEKFSDDPEEHFRIENDFLKLKLKAQYGDGFKMFGGEASMPPEIENQFLKNMIAFEENYEKAEYVKIKERIGNPAIKPIDDLNEEELDKETERLLTLLEKHKIHLGFNYDEAYEKDVIYKFLTETFLNEEVEKIPLGKMTTHFIYEDFCPNYYEDLKKDGHQFLAAWLSGDLEKVEEYLADTILTEKGKQIPKETIFLKIKNRFDAFEKFENDGYNIYDIGFEVNDEKGTGMGHVEGNLKVDCIIENGEKVTNEGQYKIYFTFEYGFWQVIYFVIPGFSFD